MIYRKTDLENRGQEAVKKLGESDSTMLLRKSWMAVHCTCDERGFCPESCRKVQRRIG